MNRYALEMHTRERYASSLADASPYNHSVPANRRRRGFLSRAVSAPNDSQLALTGDQSMAFIYELRCDFAHVDLDLTEILPVSK
jgi:hypothetical protein